MKINNKKSMFGIIVLVIFSILIFIVIALQNNNDDKQKNTELDRYLTEKINFPKNSWLRNLETHINKSGVTAITNNYDGYIIDLAPNWQFEDTIDPLAGFLAYKPKDVSQRFNNPEDGIELRILTLKNTEKISVLDWLANSKEARDYFSTDDTFKKVNHQAGIAYKTSSQIPIKYADWLELDIAPDASLEKSYVENSMVVQYVFGNRNRIFIASCIVVDENYITLISECEKQIQTFQIL